MLALLCALAFSQHSPADPELAAELAAEVAEAEGRLDGLEFAIEQRALELALVTAQASRLVELLAADFDGSRNASEGGAEGPDLDTGDELEPENQLEPASEAKP